jgi:hypothetical protein
MPAQQLTGGGTRPGLGDPFIVLATQHSLE